MKMDIDAGVFNRLGASFQFLGVFMDRQCAMDMQRLMGEKILKKALELVPVRTGALKSTGRVVKSQDRKGIEVRFGNGRINYALVVEYGRIQFAPFPPKPYIRPAVRWASRNFKRDAKLKLDKAIAASLPKVITSRGMRGGGGGTSYGR